MWPLKRFLLCLLSVCLTLAVPGATAQEPLYPCEPSGEVKRALASLPDMMDFSLTLEQRLGPLRVLVNRYPRDIFVERRYQDFLRSKFHLAEQLDQAFAMYGRGRGAPLGEFLYARMLLHLKPVTAEGLLNEVLQKDSKLAWAHLAIVEKTEIPRFGDPAKAEKHMREFLKACPNSLEAYTHFKNIQDADMVAQAAHNLRRLLDGRAEAGLEKDMVGYYRSLWDLEFLVTLKDKHQEVRARVRADLAKLQSLERAPTREWMFVMQRGYDLAGEPAGKDKEAMDAAILKNAPSSSLALSVVQRQWDKENPTKPGMTGDEVKKHWRRRYEKVSEWRKNWPNDPGLSFELFRTIRVLPELSADEVLAILDEQARVLREKPDFGWMTPPFEIETAEFYVKYKVRLEQVPRLVSRGLELAEVSEKYRSESEVLPPETRPRLRWGIDFSNLRGHGILADLYTEQKGFDQARIALNAMAADLERMKPPASAAERDQGQFGYWESQYLERLARLAEAQENKQEALRYYQQMVSRQPKEAVEKASLPAVSAARKLYLEQGGTQEGWLAWAAPSGKSIFDRPPVRFTKPFPDFALKDLQGRTWRLADLKGKAVFLNVWATW